MYCKARADITEVHFLPFNPTDKRTALTFTDKNGKMHRASKGAPEQVQSISASDERSLTTLPLSFNNISNYLLLCSFRFLIWPGTKQI